MQPFAILPAPGHTAHRASSPAIFPAAALAFPYAELVYPAHKWEQSIWQDAFVTTKPLPAMRQFVCAAIVICPALPKSPGYPVQTYLAKLDKLRWLRTRI